MGFLFRICKRWGLLDQKQISEEFAHLGNQGRDQSTHKDSVENQHNDQQDGSHKDEKGRGDHEQEIPGAHEDTEGRVDGFRVAILYGRHGMLQVVGPVVLGEAPETGEEPLGKGSQGLAVIMVVPNSVTYRENDVAYDHDKRNQRGNEDQ